MSVIDFILTIFLPQLYHKFLDVLFAPFYYPDMIWIIIPLVISVLLMELYFGRYPREEMGYHMALENTVFLLFVSVDLIRKLMLEHQGISSVKIFFVGVILLYSIGLAILDFFHKLSRNIAFKISSKTLVGFTAYTSIIIVYSEILIDITPISIITSIFSILILFVVFHTIIRILKFMEPKSHDDVDDLLQGVETDLRNAAKEVNGKGKK